MSPVTLRPKCHYCGKRVPSSKLEFEQTQTLRHPKRCKHRSWDATGECGGELFRDNEEGTIWRCSDCGTTAYSERKRKVVHRSPIRPKLFCSLSCGYAWAVRELEGLEPIQRTTPNRSERSAKG